MKRLFHILLALSFASLQCVAPLAHAHVGGGGIGQGIHLPEVQQVPASAELSCCAETPESPSVGVAQGFERNEQAPVTAGEVAQVRWTPQTIATRAAPVRQPVAHPLIFPTPSYSKPHSQAPPAWSNL